MHPASEAAICELDCRSIDSIDVALLWNSQTNRVYVAVHDTRGGESFEFEADPAYALVAFHHPFPYAGNRRCHNPIADSSQPLGSTP